MHISGSLRYRSLDTPPPSARRFRPRRDDRIAARALSEREVSILEIR
jgi:hypothetical protein